VKRRIKRTLNMSYRTRQTDLLATRRLLRQDTGRQTASGTLHRQAASGALRLIVLVLALAPSAFVSACIGSLGHKVRSVLPRPSVTGPSVSVETGESLPEDSVFYHRLENVIRLIGAVNETVAFQFVLSATDGQAAGVELVADDFVGSPGTIPRDAVHMYRQWPVTIERYPNWYLRSQGLRQPRDVLDVLVPIDAPRHGQPFVIAPGSRLTVWVEIRIPSDAAPGAYASTITVRDADGHNAATPVELVVRDIYLSPNDAIPILARVQLAPIIAAHTDVDPLNIRLAITDEKARGILHCAFSILHAHGLSPYTDDVRPLFTQDRDGAVQLDWTDYDAFCGPLIDGNAYRDGRPAHAWPLPVDLAQPDPALFGGIQSTVYAAVLNNTLSSVKDYFEENGWLDQSFVYFDLLQRRNPQSDVPSEVRRLAAITHLVDERLAFVSTLIPQSMTPFGWFGHDFEDLTAEVDIWSTPARYQHPRTLEHLQALGKRTWLLPDRPPFSGSMAVEAPAIQARSLPWQAFLQAHEAVVLPRVTDWPDRVLDEPIRGRDQPSDTWLLYPGTAFGLKEPVPSVRLKQLQLGIQEYQYLRLLATHGRGETARLIAGSLIKAAGTEAYGDNYQDGLFGRRVDDAEIWELARAVMIDEVSGALTESTRIESEQIAVQAAWAKFLNATRRIEVWPESARLVLDKRPGQSGYQVRYDIAIRSELRTPLEGGLKVGAVTPGMRSVSDVIRVGPIPEMGLVRKQLVVETPDLPPSDLDGHHTQPIVFDAGTSGHVQTDATLSIVQVPHVPNAVTVDGDLSDWPPNAFNIAGDFRLINAWRNGTSSVNRQSPIVNRQSSIVNAPVSRTVAYFCQNAGVLYIGIHAAAPAEERACIEDRPLRNFVEYEDLMPLDEDLVEILIDPTNAGTQSGDLYHIVLKSSGIPVFERGIGMVPSIGKWQPWPGDPPRCCVRMTEYGWSAELAIPIAAFGPQAARNPIWGINLARLEPANGEYSDWARVPRYCYDPRTLGNLVWPE